MYVCVYVCIYLYVRVYDICISICMYVCRQAGRQAGIHPRMSTWVRYLNSTWFRPKNAQHWSQWMKATSSCEQMWNEMESRKIFSNIFGNKSRRWALRWWIRGSLVGGQFHNNKRIIVSVHLPLVVLLELSVARPLIDDCIDLLSKLSSRAILLSTLRCSCCVAFLLFPWLIQHILLLFFFFSSSPLSM